ncbi:cyclic peptide transporter subfamily [Synechococcus sp. PCC 7335]|uniref:cyclic peptide export ABC transporter n=1 Tax=Synechococcus sp. (strain ATCC 29403 / PCC 7335) TaxID=91464 RepID=UPI00017EDCAA|nr:cyclic peptide export ABC transporter [Synechococcus sp. PCC 7335]EDX87608.1 cyclic peptide transporter subfamily [Synechococcus sp. PCC 7335]
MDIIWMLLRSSWISVVVAVVSGLISGVGSAALIALINTAIEQGTPRSLILPFAGLALLALVTGAISQFLLIDLAQDSVYQLRMRLSQRILASPLQQLEAVGPSNLLAVLTEDVQSISNSVFVLPYLCIDIAVICGCLLYLGILSTQGVALVVAFLVVAIALVQTLITAAYRYIALAREEVDRLFKNFRGITEGIKELKLNTLRRQRFIDEDLRVTAATTRDYNKTAFKLASLSTGSGQLLFFTLIGIMLFGVPQLVPNIRPVLPAYILTLTYVVSDIEGLLGRLPNLLSANASIRKVTEMGLTLSQQAEISSPTKSSHFPAWRTLTLEGVTHTYRSEEIDGTFTVGPIDLTIKANELIFIVGGNGSGKSTLAKLITSLYIPDSGQLILDNEPITDINREWYRQLFSTVFSDYYLFERLVSTEETSLEEVTPRSTAQNYLEKLQLEEKVSIQNGQLSTTALSQGQRKRLALLAAYLEDRSLYLFDEWAADQDPVFREIFYTQLLGELIARGKTIIVISHDDHYFHIADRIIKLDYGQIESDEVPQRL